MKVLFFTTFFLLFLFWSPSVSAQYDKPIESLGFSDTENGYNKQDRINFNEKRLIQVNKRLNSVESELAKIKKAAKEEKEQFTQSLAKMRKDLESQQRNNQELRKIIQNLKEKNESDEEEEESGQ